MALYIDFNFINIRDLIDFSEVDSEFENQLQSLVEAVFDNQSEDSESVNSDFEKSAIKFLSEIVAESDSTLTAETTVNEATGKDVLAVISTPLLPMIEITTPKPTAAPKAVASASKPVIDKKEAYIKYINSKYEQSQADYFIGVLRNPLETHLRNRFDYADSRNSYLNSQILSKDKDSTDGIEKKRHGQDEDLRNIEIERRIESLKKSELNRLFEQKNKENYKKV